MKKYKVLFCDLDGTLIDTLSGEPSPKGVWDMKLRFKTLDAVKNLAPEYVFILPPDTECNPFKREYIAQCVKSYCNIKNSVHCTPYVEEPVDKLDRYWEILTRYKSYTKEDCLMIACLSDDTQELAANFGIDYLNVDDFVAKIKEDEK